MRAHRDLSTVTPSISSDLSRIRNRSSCPMAFRRGERRVLKALRDLQGDSDEEVDDALIADRAEMGLDDTRTALESLETEGFVDRVRLRGRIAAVVTPRGRQELRMSDPFPSASRTEPDLPEGVDDPTPSDPNRDHDAVQGAAMEYYQNGVARILRAGNLQGPVGVGIVVGRNRVLTCAHVVNQALFGTMDGQAHPVGTVDLMFPLLGGDGRILRGRVTTWYPESEDFRSDIAVITLNEDVPVEVGSVTFVDERLELDVDVRIFGFRQSDRRGNIITATHRGGIADGTAQLDSGAEVGVSVEPGFSGSAVWCTTRKKVAGMIVRANSTPGEQFAYMVPSSTLRNILDQGERGTPDDHRDVEVRAHREVARILGLVREKLRTLDASKKDRVLSLLWERLQPGPSHPGSDQIEQLAKRIVDPSPISDDADDEQDPVGVIVKLCEDFARENRSDYQSTIDQLTEVVDLVLPAHIPTELLKRFAESIDETGVGFVKPGAILEATVDVLIAWKDGMSPKFKYETDGNTEKSKPIGICLRFECPPIDSPNRSVLSDVLTQIYRDVMYPIPVPERSDESKEDYQEKLIRELKEMLKDQRKSKYCVVLKEQSDAQAYEVLDRELSQVPEIRNFLIFVGIEPQLGIERLWQIRLLKNLNGLPRSPSFSND